MNLYEWRLGDGNMGTDFIEEFEAINIDEAVKYVLEYGNLSKYVIENHREEGDDQHLSLVVDDGPDGECALNGGAWCVVDINFLREVK